MISRARLKYLRSLKRGKVREREGVLLVEGINAVEEAVARGLAREVFLGDDVAGTPRGRALLARKGVPVQRIEARDVEALAFTRGPAGAFALTENPCGPLDAAALPRDAIVLFAAGVADPGNLGTLVRTAAALGAAAVAVAPGSVEATNPKAVRASAGAVFRLPVGSASAEDLVSAGFELWVADAAGEAVTGIRARPSRVALVLGSEPHGVDAATRARAHRSVAVPLAEGAESLNVAVAAGILLHALRGLAGTA